MSKRDEALAALKTGPRVLPVSTGSKLVADGLAVKTDKTGCGKAKAEYRLA